MRAYVLARTYLRRCRYLVLAIRDGQTSADPRAWLWPLRKR